MSGKGKRIRGEYFLYSIAIHFAPDNTICNHNSLSKGFMEREPRLVWIDLEMTGLDPQKDLILEIATIITDNNLAVIEEGPSLVIHADEVHLQGMHQEVKDLFSKSDLIDRVRVSKVTLQEAEEQTVAFIKKHCIGNSPLCGNSVWTDRGFLSVYMPRVIELLHYRIIDVSSIKEVINRWYPNNSDTNFLKRDTHRALADIKESIAELKYYRRHFFV